MTFNTDQQDLFFGSLLGDGNLQTDTGGRTWRYRALQKAEHKEYLFHKYNILQPLCGEKTVPKFNLPPSGQYQHADKRTGTPAKRWYFNTLTNPSLKFYGDMFYTFDRFAIAPKGADSGEKKWVKDVPMNVEKFLTPRAVAYWYMDDGALKWRGRSNAMRICTESFSHDGVKRLQKALQNNFGIFTKLAPKYGPEKIVIDGSEKPVIVGYRILIPEESSAAFRELIKPYLVDCMKYKVSDGKRGNL
jgi:hypothetical protein